MRKTRRILFLALATFALAACTQDEPSSPTEGVEGALPDGEYPLELTAKSTQAVATPSTRSTLDGNWEGAKDKVAVIVDGETKEYTLTPSADNTTATLASDNPFYWTSTDETMTVEAWYPCESTTLPETWEVPADQSAGMPDDKDFLYAKQSIPFSGRNETGLTFKHCLAKVVINIQQSDYLKSYGDDLSVQLTGLLTTGKVTHSEDYFVMIIQGDVSTGKTTITPHRLDTPADGAFASYEALVIPQSVNIDPSSFPAIEVRVGDATYKVEISELTSSSVNFSFYANSVHTFDITVKAESLEVSVDTGSMTWEDGASGEGSVVLPV